MYVFLNEVTLSWVPTVIRTPFENAHVKLIRKEMRIIY
jgi:hypothetical protein